MFIFGLLVVLAIVSLGTLLSIFLAAVIALGLDPVVGALVRRGWNRGRAAVVVFAAVFVAVFVLVLVSAGPVWEEIVEFVKALPAYWDELKEKPAFQDIVNAAGADDKISNALKDLAAGLPDAASALLGVRRRRVRLGAVARHADVPVPVPADGAPDDHRVAVRLRAAGDRGALAAGRRGLDQGGVVDAARQPRDLGRGRHDRRRCPRGCSGSRSRSSSA